MQKLLVGPREKIPLDVNRRAVSEITPVKAALAQTCLRREAHRVGLVLAHNRVSRLLVAGRGRLNTCDGAPVPLRSFFALEAAGPRRTAVGYLAIAARKAGVTIHTVSGRYAFVDSKGFLPGLEARLQVGIACRFTRPDERAVVSGKAVRTRQGTPTHLYLPKSPERLIDFYQNGARSILWAWLDDSFRKNALALLKEADTHFIDLPV